MADGYADQLNSELVKIVGRYPAVGPLRSALEYALFPGGKRIRPLFSLLLCRDLAGSTEHLLGAAASLELVHAASLIHDDLPALDNDDMRRGRPSCHKAFGEATALLAGDLLVSLAMEVLTHTAFSSDQNVRMIQVLARSFRELCNGQQLDLLPANERGDLSTLHRLKTGSLFGAAAIFAGIAAGLSGRALQCAEELGVLIGLYFQIVDDFIDVFGGEFGKGRVGSSDQRNCKETYFHGGDISAGKLVVQETQRAIEGCLEKLKAQANVSEHGFPGTCYVLQRVAAPLKGLQPKTGS